MARSPASGVFRKAPGADLEFLPRPGQLSELLLQGQDEPVGAAKLGMRCLERLAHCLEVMADWTGAGWRVGDYNQCVVTAAVGEELEVVQTFTTEPEEDVHWRVSAGGRTGETGLGFDRQLCEQLFRFGLSLASDGTTWERIVRVGTTREAEYSATEALLLLSDVFGYRGQTSLSLTIIRGQRTEPGQVYRALAPDDLRKLLHGWGYQANLGTTASGNPVIRTGAGGFKFHILFAWPIKDSRQFGCLDFITVFLGRPGLTVAAVNEISRSSRFSRLYLDDENDLILERDISLTGGVTADYLRECMLDWTCMMESVLRKVEKAVAPPLVMH